MFWVKLLIFIFISSLGFLAGSLASSPLMRQEAKLLQGFSSPEEIVITASPLVSASPEISSSSFTVLKDPEMELADGVYRAFEKEGAIFIKNKNTGQEKLVLKTRLRIHKIFWEDPEFLTLETISEKNEIIQYRLFLTGKLENI
jgi:hypothetical protein